MVDSARQVRGAALLAAVLAAQIASLLLLAIWGAQWRWFATVFVLGPWGWCSG